MAFSTAAQAQEQAKDTTLTRTVVVEQEYNPDIMDASKVNVLPKVEPLATTKKQVEYDATLTPAAHIPATVMEAYGGKETQPKAQPGYARLGYGNGGNLDARAGYLFTLSRKDRLGLTFGMDGMDGKLDVPESGESWQSYYYRTRAGMDYTHAFRKVDLNLAGNFGLSNFNFLPGSANSKQKFTSGDVHLGVKSTGDDLPLRFSAESNLLLYERQHDLAFHSTKESVVRTRAEAAGDISDLQSVGVALGMDNIFYNGRAFEDYHTVNLNPYYLFHNDNWNVRLGAHVDLAFGFGKKWFAAPDFSARYTFSDSYVLYARATGGRLQNDFRQLESIDPYAALDTQAELAYEQLNAAIGFKMSPLPDFWFHLYGGHQRLTDDFYTANHRFMQGDADNTYAGAALDYSYKELIAFHAAGVYHHWNADNGQEHLYLKPVFEADARIDIRPVTAVTASIGYRFASREGEEPVKAASVSNLYLGGSYELFKHIAVYVRANNLLNKSYQVYRGYPVQGINFTGGVSFRF